MRILLFFWMGILVTTAAIAQTNQSDENKPQLSINIKFNSAQNRYEVYAHPNFKATRFALGPSQISIILPEEIDDQPLPIVSKTANWADYSVVYAPKAEPDVDIHGITTMGMLIDFEKDAQILLFSFSLPKGYVDGVRLFMNGKDPNSAQVGMMGGDFSNVITGINGPGKNAETMDFFHSSFDKTNVLIAN